MYNIDFQCTYLSIKDETLSNKMYQTELLKALGLSTYDDDVTSKIEEILNSAKDLSNLSDELKKKWLFDLHMFMLFSYDYFQYTHEFLCDFFEKRNTIDSYNNLSLAISNS